MKVGLIDVDGHNFPNLPLMKLSAYHKQQGDSVEWYKPTISGHMDTVYLSKVFSFTPDYLYPIDADIVHMGGTGYAIHLEEGKEVFDRTQDRNLPDEIEHIYPDYSIYNTDKAYGFLTRGCPRGCTFCHVASKEGQKSYKVADLDEFWQGQKDIVLLDPNMFASEDWQDLADQLVQSKATIEFNQGIDIRTMTEPKMDYLRRLKTSMIHFAWDRYEDKDTIIPKLEAFKHKDNMRHVSVYVLCNYDTTIEQDLERIYTLRAMQYSPYVMLYDKDNIPKGHIYRKLQRYANNRYVFWSCDSFDKYMKGE